MLRLLSLFVASALVALPGTVISVAGNGTLSLGGLGAVSWTQTGTFAGVTVSAEMNNISGAGQSLSFHAYLTDAIGPGASVADEIASTAFTIAPGFNQVVNLFQVANLGPGTYFLVIAPDGGTTPVGGWAGTSTSPTVSLGAGVVRNADRGTSGTFASYPPATNIPALTGGSLLYSVTSADVPEPATTALVVAGLAAIVLRRARVG
ncbi:MAG: PEP-CTERM sorting domain-containing protein [Bryobacterales bacterium]|nr:PEP-CTERM sorting domain-containing protein [Bryobacterales bacterium]